MFETVMGFWCECLLEVLVFSRYPWTLRTWLITFCVHVPFYWALLIAICSQLSQLTCGVCTNCLKNVNLLICLCACDARKSTAEDGTCFNEGKPIKRTGAVQVHWICFRRDFVCCGHVCWKKKLNYNEYHNIFVAWMGDVKMCVCFVIFHLLNMSPTVSPITEVSHMG